jgi:probable HAF family extracellular repeat protein
MIRKAALALPLVVLCAVSAPAVSAAAPAAAAKPARALVLVPHDLGDLGGMPRGVNDRFVVVGVRQFTAGIDRAFRRDPRTGRVTDLGTLGGMTSEARDVNATGLVTGSADTAAGNRHAFRWDPRTRRMRDLGTLGGTTSYATAVDARGAVVGWSGTVADGSAEHAFRWDPRTGRMRDLGTLGGAWSQALGVSPGGVVVGVAATADELGHAFRWDPRTGRMTDLGVLPKHVVSFAADANDRGLVAGWSASVGDDTGRPFAWTRAGGMREIFPLGGGFADAIGVDAHGLVAGTHWGPPPVAYAWDAATGRSAALQLPGAVSTWATDVSDGGLVLVDTSLAAGDHTVVWRRVR